MALAPKEPLILGGLGRALLNMDDDSVTAEARDALARSAAADKANSDVLRDLALAEARLGHEGAAALATAERFTLEGRFRDADRNAERAAALLPEGSPGWRRAQDIDNHGETRAELKDPMRQLLLCLTAALALAAHAPLPAGGAGRHPVLAVQRQPTRRRCTPRSAPICSPTPTS